MEPAKIINLTREYKEVMEHCSAEDKLEIFLFLNTKFLKKNRINIYDPSANVLAKIQRFLGSDVPISEIRFMLEEKFVFCRNLVSLLDYVEPLLPSNEPQSSNSWQSGDCVDPLSEFGSENDSRLTQICRILKLCRQELSNENFSPSQEISYLPSNYRCIDVVRDYDRFKEFYRSYLQSVEKLKALVGDAVLRARNQNFTGSENQVQESFLLQNTNVVLDKYFEKLTKHRKRLVIAAIHLLPKLWNPSNSSDLIVPKKTRANSALF